VKSTSVIVVKQSVSPQVRLS